MESEEKIKVLQDLFSVDWDGYDEDMSDKLVRYVSSLLNDYKCIWHDDEPFIEVLLDEFSDDHTLWSFIELE